MTAFSTALYHRAINPDEEPDKLWNDYVGGDKGPPDAWKYVSCRAALKRDWKEHRSHAEIAPTFVV